MRSAACPVHVAQALWVDRSPQVRQVTPKLTRPWYPAVIAHDAAGGKGAKSVHISPDAEHKHALSALANPTTGVNGKMSPEKAKQRFALLLALTEGIVENAAKQQEGLPYHAIAEMSKQHSFELKVLRMLTQLVEFGLYQDLEQVGMAAMRCRCHALCTPVAPLAPCALCAAPDPVPCA